MRAFLKASVKFLDPPDLLNVLVQFQGQQRTQLSTYFAVTSAQNSLAPRHAQVQDVNITLKLDLIQASHWGGQFAPFCRLPSSLRNIVLAEYGLGFLLVDQGFKTAKDASDGLWLLQNGSFLHSEYANQEAHKNFVTELLSCVSRPFQNLKIDEVECAVLKTLLLFSSESAKASRSLPSFQSSASFARRNIFAGEEKSVASIRSKCLKEFMSYCQMQYPDCGAERFGNILLLISPIRCAVKSLYNQTRQSDLFNLTNFDPIIQHILLS